MLSIVLTFSSGQSVGDAQTTSVTIQDDSSVENDEVFSVSISSMDSGVVLGISTAWVTIIEDSTDSMLPCSTGWCVHPIAMYRKRGNLIIYVRLILIVYAYTLYNCYLPVLCPLSQSGVSN